MTTAKTETEITNETAKTETVKAKTRATKKTSDLVTVCLRSHRDIVFTINDKNILIKGHNSALRGINGGVLDSGEAFGETVIARSDWEAIQEKYGKDPNFKLFSGGYLFAAASKEDAKAEAKEKENLKTGNEPIDPKKTITEADTKS